MKIQKGDTVLVTAGKDRGRTGKVLRVLPQEGRLAVEGLNIHKKHRRPRKSGEKGQVVEIPGAFSASNVKLVCPKCGKAVRLARTGTGKEKARVCKKCGSAV